MGSVAWTLAMTRHLKHQPWSRALWWNNSKHLPVVPLIFFSCDIVTLITTGMLSRHRWYAAPWPR